MKRLNELFTISSGFTFRDSVTSLESGNVGVVQSSDITGGKLSSVDRVKFGHDKSLLRVGDILLSIRGNFVARTVTPDLLPAVAASSVIVLRAHDDALNTRYIARYINSNHGQAQLAKITTGSQIKTLRKSELLDYRIPQPSGFTQDTVVSLHETIDSYRLTLDRKQQLLRQLDDAVINKLEGAR